MTASFHSSKTTTTASILILIIVYTFITHTTSGVNAQLYVSCNTDSSSGTLLETCYVNRASPLTYTAADGTPIILGSVSSLAVRCSTSVPGTVDTCECAIAIDPVDSIQDDVCKICMIIAINETVFENYFDCSDQLTGSCVGLTATGECISNIAAPAPFIDPISTTLSPRPTPFPMLRPTMNSPIIIPVVLPSNDQDERTTNNLSVGIVIAIGAVGGIALSVLVAYCMTLKKRQPTRKITKPMDKSLVPTVTSREYSTSNVDNTDTSTQPPPIGARNPTLLDNNNINQPNHRTADWTIPENTQSYKATIPSSPQPLTSAPAVAIQPRPSYPVNPNLHFKDQCRGVAPVVTAVLSSPVVFVSQELNTTALPFAVAVDASAVSSVTNVPVSTSENRNKNKTRDRMLLDA